MRDLEGEVAAAREGDGLRLTKTTTAQEIVAALTEKLSAAKLARIWIMLSEHLKAVTPRHIGEKAETPTERKDRRLARYLYPTVRRPGT